jgi:hypothetical protein
MRSLWTETNLRPRPAITSGLGLAVALGLTFTILCSLRIAGDSTGIIGGNVVLRSVLKGPIWATKLARNIALLVAIHVALSIALGIMAWLLALLSEAAWGRNQVTRRQWVLCWSIVAFLWILVANAAYFPWSSLGEPYARLVTQSTGGINAHIVITAAASLAAISTTVFGLLNVSRRTRKSRGLVLSGAAAVVVSIAAFAASTWLPNRARATADPKRPNVIFVGIDSLRSDVVRGGWGEAITPNVDAFLHDSVSFTDAITPLARTFPSWVATLSGKHPHATGAIMNLLPRDLIDAGETLPETLRKAGYRTVYATDEVRFSNIDGSFGFDQIIAPPMGASDFLLGSLNDLPLSNLLANTQVGQWLFPNLHGNRGAAATYDPDTFVGRLARELLAEQPAFVAVHLTLPHWPYYWATAPSRSDDTGDEAREIYTTALRRVDAQFAGVLSVLRGTGILDNAIVIVMSDHGESIGRPDDSPYQAEGSNQPVRVLNGHGTSVLSPQQYHVVLGLQTFGSAAKGVAGSKLVDAPVSLLDLAPTVLGMLGVKSTQDFDGTSLVPFLAPSAAPDAAATLSHRVRFTESEFNPRGFQPGKTVTSSALAEVMSFYEIDPQSDRILVRRDRIRKLLLDRQYAAILGTESVVALPNGHESAFDLLLANSTAYTYHAIDPNALSASGSNAGILLEALRRRFGIEANGALVPPSAAMRKD